MSFTFLNIVDWLLWIILAASTLYILIFSLACLLPTKKKSSHDIALASHHFLVLFPAYKEDAVILNSVHSLLHQDYPSDLFHVAVISDHMLPETNKQLSELPITLLQPSFEKSSKAKALQYAIENTSFSSLHPSLQKVVILDADNVVEPDFLSRLNAVCQQGHQVIQCHRTAKNSDNGIAALDGVSEEINNSLFRRGHSRLGLSAGLIGSGMCFDYELFSKNVFQLSSAVEDRELEGLLARQGVHIHYAEDIMVYDEKVSSSDNFQRQRLRWMSGQVQTLLLMLPYLPKAILRGNINYVDKTIQQALIPRSLLLLFTFPIACFLTLGFVLWGNCTLLNVHSSMMRWWLLFSAQCLAIFIAIPANLRWRALGHVFLFPRMAMLMCKNLLRIRINDKEFHHTTHGTTKAGEAK
jgi:cellulose synthase/poly-beta-1,6-N-acetylglucosamine synthase-like glycosyltransferase